MTASTTATPTSAETASWVETAKASAAGSDPRLRIALVNARNSQKKYALNKDLNGGLGTADDLGESLPMRILVRLRRRFVHIPIVEFAFLQSVLRERGHQVTYFEAHLPEKEIDLILIYGSIVDFKNENAICRQLKDRFPRARVGFWGPFPSRFPDHFNAADFVLQGEPEAFFAGEFAGLETMQGNIPIHSLPDMDALPSPSFDGFPISEYRYFPAVSQRPFLTLEASRGCPYSCRFYCTYGEYQGAKVRLRSATRVVDDIVRLQRDFGIKAVQFRDPIFGIDKKFVGELCDELERRRVEITWVMETRLDLLDEERLTRMFKVGLRVVNVGIETSDADVARISKRRLVEENHQERIIRFCHKVGIKVSAFYILALEADTEETIDRTIRYAIHLNTPLARFSVSTPYPGTGFYDRLEKEGRIRTHDFEDYTQFHLVFDHENLEPVQVRKLLARAYLRYYSRPSYWLQYLWWKIRELWL